MSTVGERFAVFERENAEAQGAAGATSRVLVALESLSVPQRAALLSSADALATRGVEVLILAPAACAIGLDLAGYRARNSHVDATELAELRPSAVLASSSVEPTGALGYEVARRLQSAFFVVQHGVLTPFAPPLPHEAHLLAWSEADARRWAEATGARWSAVGSQLLYEAAHRAVPPELDARAEPSGPDDGLLFLGQLHGHELPREVTLSTCALLARRGPLDYRPHPGEVDPRSRAQHQHLERQGVRIVANTSLLPGRGRPVVAIFSTGVLEAAAAGRSAFVACVDPPEWVEEVWRRYGMSNLASGIPTAVAVEATAPALRIATIVEASR